MVFIALGLMIDVINLIYGIRLSSGHRESGLPIVPVILYCVGIGQLIWRGFGVFNGFVILFGLIFTHASCIFIIPWLVVFIKRRFIR